MKMRSEYGALDRLSEGKQMLEAGHCEGAVACFDEIMALDPNPPTLASAHFNRLEALRKLGKDQEARAAEESWSLRTQPAIVRRALGTRRADPPVEGAIDLTSSATSVENNGGGWGTLNGAPRPTPSLDGAAEGSSLHWGAVIAGGIAGVALAFVAGLVYGAVAAGEELGGAEIAVLVVSSSRVPGSGVRGRGSGERETTASSLAGKEESSRKEDNSGQGKDGPAGAIAQGGNGR